MNLDNNPAPISSSSLPPSSSSPPPSTFQAQVRALAERVPLPNRPIMISPSSKRKREVVLQIPQTPDPTVNANNGNESPSTRRSSLGSLTQDNDAPSSPRSKVASKLQQLTLHNLPITKRSAFRDWRKGSSNKSGRMDISDSESSSDGGGDNNELVARKKRAIGSTFSDSIDGSVPVSAKLLSDSNDIDRGRPRARLDTSPPYDEATVLQKPLADGNTPAVTLTPAPGNVGKRRLRSPPPDPNNQFLDVEDEDTDSDLDQNGVGFRPTANQRYIRNQKRMQQIRDYKARESREARARRSERRRRLSANRSASAKSSASSLVMTLADTHMGSDSEEPTTPKKRVHFLEA